MAAIPPFQVVTDLAGNRYIVRLTPLECEGSIGVEPRCNALVFEAEHWVGSVPVANDLRLEDLSTADLLRLLRRAV